MSLLQVVCLAGIFVSIISFGVAFYFFSWIKKLEGGDAYIENIGLMIKKGARAFLSREYKILAIFVAVAAVVIFVFFPAPIWSEGQSIANHAAMAGVYIVGSAISALAGKIGIEVATIANLKSAIAAKQGIRKSFIAGFRGGAVMGMAVVGSSLLGICALLLVTTDSNIILSFSFGASTLALFAKAGGGIFTKTADISADLVGKVELGIAEDDPRNPAVIADNVGDNVGDVAGMGADLFDSNVAALAASIVMAFGLSARLGDDKAAVMVVAYAACGLLASIIGVLSSRMGKKGSPTGALNMGTYLTTAIFAVLTFGLSIALDFSLRIWGATAIGLVAGVVIGIASDFFTNDNKKPVQNVAKASVNGPAFTILSGMSYGFLSVLPALVGIGIAAVSAYKICEPLGEGYPMFGIGMAATGMLSIVGMIISNDAYGPIVDNARGLAEMGGMGEEVLNVTDELDSAGNTVKAITKGFAIAAAGLTVIALLGSFKEIAQTAGADISFDIMNPLVFFGLMVGAAIPALFSAMLILGVNRNATRMVAEIHRQFKEIAGLKEGKQGVVPEYEKCIDIATVGALKELIPAGLSAIIATLFVGFMGGIQAIGGFLTGNIITGLLLALFMSNSGGTWDNAKKHVESGHEGGKGSDAHKAAVIGDTVGDPFKDTAGPSINTQITVVSLISNLMAVIFLTWSILG